MARIIQAYALGLWVLGAWMAGLGPAMAERGSLFPAGTAPVAGLISGPQPVSGPAAPVAAGMANAQVTSAARAPSSLFAGITEGTMFAPMPSGPRHDGPVRLQGSSPTARLLSLIATAEAGSAGYNAVVWAARIKPPKPPTHMTLGEIYAWIDATPGQHHAIGRYQFIPTTLRRVARIKGFGPEVRFSPSVQDQLAIVLLEDAGYTKFRQGQMPRQTFMRNLARIWAGLPLPNGKSYYEGYAGNSASISWAAFSGGMARIWPVGS